MSVRHPLPRTIEELESMRIAARDKYRPLVAKLSGPDLLALADVVQAEVIVESEKLREESNARRARMAAAFLPMFIGPAPRRDRREF